MDVDSELRKFCSKVTNYWPGFGLKASDMFSVVYNSTNKISSFGAILLDSRMSRALVVDHVQRKGKFSFPKGKPNEGETGPECALREVWEEVSYNIRDKINPGDAISFCIHDKRITFYIIANVGTDFVFKTKTMGEIHSIQWVTISALENDPKFKHMEESIQALKRWILKERDLQLLRETPRKYTPKRLESNPWACFRIDRKALAFPA